ncbi:liprin-beta-1-like isoform X1 [Castor canadensis]|uniref:Liprin-beta-1-like isoform X1 n=2 Tax=Castor canadensis TaxID=51338 RepID=A0AC58NBY1_CASCN
MFTCRGGAAILVRTQSTCTRSFFWRLEVSVLTDQVEAQGEKIRDLEFCLEEHREKLNATEEMQQQELLSRTSLDTQKLDLMAEIKLTTVEKDRWIMKIGSETQRV